MKPTKSLNNPAGTRVRLARLALSMSQENLAKTVGVTRQAIAGIEAGSFDPSLKVALALANALKEPVEELFGSSQELLSIEADLILSEDFEFDQSIATGERIGLARVGQDLKAIPRLGNYAFWPGLLPASATVNSSNKTIDAAPFHAIVPTLVIAGCDPALSLLEGPLAALNPPIALEWIACGSEKALKLAAQGKVHIAGSHLLDSSHNGYNKDSARSVLTSQGAQIIGFALWQEGLVLNPKFSQYIRSVDDLANQKITIINRESGSEARKLLDRELKLAGISSSQIKGYDSKASAHLLVGSTIASGLAQCGIATEVIAKVYKLNFIALSQERYDLVIPRPMLKTIEVQGLLKILASQSLRRQLGSLNGYDISILGDTSDSF